VRLQLHALAYNLGNLMRALAIPKAAEPWSLTSLREKQDRGEVVSHGRYETFKMAEVVVPLSPAFLPYAARTHRPLRTNGSAQRASTDRLRAGRDRCLARSCR